MKAGNASLKLSEQVLNAKSEEDKKKHEDEYDKILALYLALLRTINGDSDPIEAIYALMELRADYAFRHALDGFDITMDEAITLLRNMEDNNLTQHDIDLRDRLVAALNNLIDFSVCEEYQLLEEVVEYINEQYDELEDFELDDHDYEELLALCKKYNYTYAAVENADIEYAALIAAQWMSYSDNEWLVYWTQNDAKVRPWHMALQGYSAKAADFPSWMIPPIEYNCRCFLIRYEPGTVLGKMGDVKAKAEVEKPKELDGVFSESLAKCGRIFSSSHPYFNVKEGDIDMLQEFVSRLREKYYG